MLTAALFCFGVAAFIVAASVCLSIGRLLRVNAVAALDKKREWDGKTTWEDMKAAFLVYYMRCQEKEAANRKRVLSWARTLLICAVLCLIGLGVQIEFDETASLQQIVAHVKRSHASAAHSQLPPALPQQTEDQGGAAQ